MAGHTRIHNGCGSWDALLVAAGMIVVALFLRGRGVS
jgi:hypothetical protein